LVTFLFLYCCLDCIVFGTAYYFLGQQQYVPKADDLGYVMPKTVEAWLFLGLALFFLVLAFVAFAQFYQQVHKKGLVLVPQI